MSINVYIHYAQIMGEQNECQGGKTDMTAKQMPVPQQISPVNNNLKFDQLTQEPPATSLAGLHEVNHTIRPGHPLPATW